VPPLDPIPEFDLYAELNVPPFADADAIERAWRAGVRSVHPDRARTGDERAATTRTARLNIAREWLMDPTKRAQYDLLRRPGPRIEIPTIDPLGSWPVRPRRRPPNWRTFLAQAVLVSVVVVTVTLFLGPGTNVLTLVAFLVSSIVVMFGGLYVGVRVLVGAVYRRFNT
jgi:hypothetical protein